MRCIWQLHASFVQAMLQGAKPVPLLLSVAIGAALRFLVPIPSGITVQAWTLLSIFVSTITGKHTAADLQQAHMFRLALSLLSRQGNQVSVDADLSRTLHACFLCLKFTIRLDTRTEKSLNSTYCMPNSATVQVLASRHRLSSTEHMHSLTHDMLCSGHMFPALPSL